MRSKDAIAKIFHAEDLKKLEVLREKIVSQGASFEVEARIRGKEGEYRWFLIRYNPLRDEHGRVLRWYGTRTDIEDRKRAEEERRKNELAKRNADLAIASERLRSEHEVNKSSAQVQKKRRAPEKSAFEPSQIRCLSPSPTSHPTSATDSAMWPLRSGSA